MVTIVKYMTENTIPAIPGFIGFNSRTGHTINVIRSADDGHFTEWYAQPGSTLITPFIYVMGTEYTVREYLTSLLNVCETEEEKEAREYKQWNAEQYAEVSIADVELTID